MLEIKEKFFDRLDQTFTLFKNNFIKLFLPFFLYNFISVVIIGTISKYSMMKSLSGIDNLEGLDFFSFLNSPTVVIGIIVGTVFFILYLFFYIAILVGFIRSIKNVVENTQLNMLENIKYGITTLFTVMKTYWYIFSYVALIPAILFIIGGIIFNAGYFLDNSEILQWTGGGIIIVSIIIFIIFSIYRGLRSTFSVYSAVDKDEYTKENFNESISITKENVWRILGNFLLLGIIISTISSIIGGLIGILSFFGGGGSSIVSGIIGSLTTGGTFSPEDIKNLIKDYTSNFSIFNEILSNTIDNVLGTISTVFTLVFTYIFYIRLNNELSINDENTDNIKKENNLQNKEIEL